MMYYRCKCGDSIAYGSMPPNQCDWCKKCDSSLASHPDGHRERVEHDFSSVSKVATDQGPATITRCRFCGLTAAELKQRDERRAER